MARDEGLEELLNEHLVGVRGVTQKGMFGGWVWLLNGNLLCGARVGGLLTRLGKGNMEWAVKVAGVEQAVMGSRTMQGWVRATPKAYGDDALRRKLLEKAREFNRSLPAK